MLGMPQQLICTASDWTASGLQVSIPAMLGMPQQHNNPRLPVQVSQYRFYPSNAGDASATYLDEDDDAAVGGFVSIPAMLGMPQQLLQRELWRRLQG